MWIGTEIEPVPNSKTITPPIAAFFEIQNDIHICGIVCPWSSELSEFVPVVMMNIVSLSQSISESLFFLLFKVFFLFEIKT